LQNIVGTALPLSEVSLVTTYSPRLPGDIEFDWTVSRYGTNTVDGLSAA